MKILVPIDDDPRSEQALSRALSILDGGGELILGAVAELPETPQQEADAHAAMSHRLNEVAGRVSGVEVKMRITHAGDPVRGLGEIARDEEVDGVVIVSHDRGTYQALVDGTVAGELDEELSRIPVIVVQQED